MVLTIPSESRRSAERREHFRLRRHRLQLNSGKDLSRTSSSPSTFPLALQTLPCKHNAEQLN